MTEPSTTQTRTDCPVCRTRGKPVGAVTIESLVKSDALAGLERTDGWRFCSSPACDVAYFHSEDGRRLERSDVSVRIGQKETEAPRPLCYCFEHTVEDVAAEVAATGRSEVSEAIKEKCREGLDRCPETNPQGSCCLGNVRATEQAALARVSPPQGGGAEPEEAAACCVAPAAPPPERGGTWAAVGATASAILSSACCWLPLLLLAFGVSAGGLAAALDAYRPWLLGATTVLLGLAFYLTYFRREPCAPDGTCAPRRPGLHRFNQVVLWIATALVIAFALFPSYVGLLLGAAGPTGAGGDASAPSAAPLEEVVLRVEGMTCEACAVHVRAELEKVPGVRHVSVSFEESRAVVRADPGVDRAALVGAVEAAGYSASVKGA